LYHGGTISYIVNDTGDLIIDTAGDIILDVAGNDILIKSGGTTTGTIDLSNGNLLIQSNVTDKDLIFGGADGASAIVALTLDMSDAGTASFNHDIKLADNGILKIGTGGDLELYHNGSHSYISNSTGNLTVLADTLRIQNAGNDEAIIEADANGGVRIFHNNVKKFETTAIGVTVTGSIIATTDTDTSNSGNVALDFAAKQNFVLTLTGNVTLTNPSTEQVGQSGFIAFIQDGTGGRTVTLGTDYETSNASGLGLTSDASKTDLVPYVVVAANRILLGTPQLNFS